MLIGGRWARLGEISILVGGGSRWKEQLAQEFSGKLELKTYISFDPEILPLGISPTDIIKDMHKNKAAKIFPHRVDFNKN